MRILHVIASLAPRYGGPSAACLELCSELALMGHVTTIFTTDVDGSGRLDTSATRDRFSIRCFPVQAPWNLRWSTPLASTLRRELATYDIVHIHSLYLFPSWVAGHYARKYYVPYLMRPHGTLDPYILKRHRFRKSMLEFLFERRNLTNANAVHFTAVEEMELAETTPFDFKGVVVPLGVNGSDLFAPVGRPDKVTKTVLFLGRLNFKKGFDLLAKAFGVLIRSRNDVELVIAGPDEHNYRSRIMQWFVHEGIERNVTFTGMLTGRDKLMALHNADVFVLPSYSENFGIAVVEAMAAGLPVVISDRVNIWREIAKAGAGIVVRCDAAELAAALSTLLDNFDLRRTMGERGRDLVGRSFTWKVVASQMVSLYERILREHRRTSTAFDDLVVGNSDRNTETIQSE